MPISAVSVAPSCTSVRYQIKPINMKSMILVVLAVAAVAVAAPTDEVYKIVRSDFVKNPEGSYNFNYETENGIKREETGEVKEALDEDNKPHPVVVVRGSYSYTNVDGKPELVTYYADETGYHAEGESIPKSVRR